MGEFDTSSEPLLFKGRRVPAPASGQPQPTPGPEFLSTVGILLSDVKMVNGRLRATVTFDEVTPHSVCELILSHDPRTKGQVTAGLGGSGFPFVHEDGVEPTNNAAERALRTAVQWRTIGFGNRSEAGARAVARRLTVTRTCQLPSIGPPPVTRCLRWLRWLSWLRWGGHLSHLTTSVISPALLQALPQAPARTSRTARRR